MAFNRTSHDWNEKEDTPLVPSRHFQHVERDAALNHPPSTETTRTTSASAEENSGGLSLRFIDEFERQTSSQVKREIRAHVRRGTHLKRKRLNDASKPRVSSVQRPLLQRKVENSSTAKAEPTLQLPATYDHEAIVPRVAEQTPMEDQDAVSLSLHFPLSRWQFNNTTPYALLTNDNAPMLQLDARRWPFPQLVRGNGPAVSVWMPRASIPVPNARSQRPCLLRSAQVVPWIAQSLDYLMFKNEAIQWVNQRLLVPEHATSDVTIGVIIFLMSWEIARANIPELKLHINGLFRIISLRGGSPNITSVDHFCWKIALIDLLVAVLTGNEPKLSFQTQEEVLGAPAINPSIGGLQVADSPLYGTEPLALVLEGSKFCKNAVLLLQHMQDLTKGSGREEPSPLIPRNEANSQASTGTLCKIVHATSSIYCRTFNNPPTPFSSPSNADALAIISTCLEDTTNDETWTRYPGILSWIVLTALAASIHQPQCSFFAMFVFRVGTSAAWWGPREARKSIMTFLDVKRRSDGLSI
ncbi:uncharacterized protein LY89DRAFT_740264 [Mollisia scopiformis]|uniref:Tachykinin family protein n=1 Tax=Mollisia scopiformis TaxID=149040 RepID=A0A132BDQ9_MOLSC|nr:uncharacterized protein LY89DRAFT_740264 [Mollisia scopiformis]KUJ10555.1 hypothetical protein LY89DRAFT_740264 [Mollisia scopiformis]